jgi:cellulose synthase operon protein C
VVTPADRELDIETRGDVPPPQVKALGTFVQRSWRVDLSPPALLEPDSPPITEFLPSVRVGWGVSLASTLPRLVDLATDGTPLDPRLRAVALEAVGAAPSDAIDERARRLYRFTLDHVQEGKETDGRRAVTGRSGDRQSAFRYLLRLVGIDSHLAMVKDRLAMPALGGMSEIEAYDALILRVETHRGARWLTIHDKFAPYGYVPAELRGQPAVLLTDAAPRLTVDAEGAVDEIDCDGRADVRVDGSARLDLVFTFLGARAISWRSALQQVPKAQLYDFVERELIGPSFDGGHVRELSTDSADALDTPLRLHLHVEVPEFAKVTAGGLLVHPPLSPRLTQLATLPTRRTPMLRRAGWRSRVKMQVVLPDALRLPATVPQAEKHWGHAKVAVEDSVAGHALAFDRWIDLPSRRIEPGADYAAWQAFVQEADTLLARDIAVGR